MNPAVKAKWLEALRSEKYLQGVGCLKKGEEYCCLGVLADLYLEETGGKWEKGEVVGLDYCEGEAYLLPSKVQEWSAVGESGEFHGENPLDYCTLSGCNDNGKTFAEIAALIELGLDSLATQ